MKSERVPLSRDYQTKLRRLNWSLSQRTKELGASNGRLKKEIVRRHVAEKNLLQSKRQTLKLFKQSQLQQEELRRLSRRIMSIQEGERKWIGRELRDVIAQMLTGINLQLATLNIGAKDNAGDFDKKIANVQRLVERSVDVVHRFARELRPAALDDLGLIPALHSFTKSFSKATGIRIEMTASEEVEKLSSTKRTVLYRVAQEALTNIARHSKACRGGVNIQKLPADIRMEISDDGEGFDLKRVISNTRFKRLGLIGTRERVEMVGGKFTVESSPGRGTNIYAQIPFKNSAKEHTHP